jgi:hypothetical protein
VPIGPEDATPHLGTLRPKRRRVKKRHVFGGVTLTSVLMFMAAGAPICPELPTGSAQRICRIITFSAQTYQRVVLDEVYIDMAELDGLDAGTP